ncbi:MAG: hypothetical protein LBU94_01690 [Clostridiales bacterium]|jgi:hypothetical protein|nr:hypothetical protein [Clostridiales bacterium]
MPFFEKKTYCGDLLLVDKYYSMRDGKKTKIHRGENGRLTEAEQQKLNNAHAQRRLVQLINTNFSRKQGDIFVTLTYSEPPDDEATAKKHFNRFARKVRAYRKENSLPDLKYITICEKQGQVHFHVIMNDLPLKVLDDLWGRGRVTVSTLDNTYNFKDLAGYLVKQDKQAKIKPNGENVKDERRKYARRWSSSKNLKTPVEKKRYIKRVTKTLPKPPKGYRLLPDWEIGSDKWGNLYQHYSCLKLEEALTKRRKNNVLLKM